jgi:thiamine pyrophosphate-dependent acetolactate synthase large subunit-like protein
MQTTGPRYIAEILRGYGVTHLFFVPQMLLETLTSLEGKGIRRVVTHGEKAAAYMADGYARASGRPGICMAQHVGASNLAAGLRDAYLACSPVIAMTGGPAAARYRHAYQELRISPNTITRPNSTGAWIASPVCRICCARPSVRRRADHPGRCICNSAVITLPANAVLVSDTGHSDIWTGAFVEFFFWL